MQVDEIDPAILI